MIIYKLSDKLSVDDFIKSMPEKKECKFSKRKIDGGYLVTFNMDKSRKLDYLKDEQKWVPISENVKIGKYKDDEELNLNDFLKKNGIGGEEIELESGEKIIVGDYGKIPTQLEYDEKGNITHTIPPKYNNINEITEKLDNYFLFGEEPYGMVDGERDVEKYWKEMIHDLCIILQLNYTFNEHELLLFGVLNRKDFETIILKFLRIQERMKVVEDFQNKKKVKKS